MKLSPAPTPPQRPDSAACSSARGAGDQFAANQRLTSWDEGYGAGLSARADDDAEQEPPGRVGGIQRRWVWIGTVGPVKDGHGNAGLVTEWHGQAWPHVTPRNRGNFTRPCVARRGGSGPGAATRYPERNLGQFSRHGRARHGAAMRGLAGQCNNVTGDGNPGHFPKHQEAPASRGATVDGMTGSV